MIVEATECREKELETALANALIVCNWLQGQDIETVASLIVSIDAERAERLADAILEFLPD
jgi:hypothetical protein